MADVIDDNMGVYTQILATINTRTEGHMEQLNTEILADCLKDHPGLDDLRIVPTDKKTLYLVWNNEICRWEFDTSGNSALTRTLVKSLLNDVLKALRMTFEEKRTLISQDTTIIDEAARAKAIKSVSTLEKYCADKVNAIINGSGTVLLEYLQKYIASKDVRELNSYQRYRNTPSGTLDIKTKSYLKDKKFIKSLYLTDCTAVDYNLSAKTPVKFLEGIDYMAKQYDTEEEQSQFKAMINDVLGLFVIGRTGKYAIYLLAPKNTCKSSLLYPPKVCMGSYGCAPPNTLFNKNDNESSIALGSIMGKTVALVSELESSDKKFNEETFKKATGGDELSARVLYVGYTNFVYNGVFVITSNHAPKFEHASDDMKTRLRVIKLGVDFEQWAREGKLTLLENAPQWLVKNELEGIFKHMVDCASDILNRKDQQPRFMNDVSENTQELFSEQSIYASFINDAMTPKVGERIVFPLDTKISAIYKSYESYVRGYAIEYSYDVAYGDLDMDNTSRKIYIASPKVLKKKLCDAGLAIQRKSIRDGSKNPGKEWYILDQMLKAGV